ncbi:ParM/StbA family protein [Rummeliibacillus stabekisii]|uniref:ParM/StbA family protein n=1 Tax=Rummeliibacillus stabekisii TaxID=241244 RepID=UPI00371AE7C1
MVKTRKVGVDSGNGSGKIYLDGNLKLNIPTVYAEQFDSNFSAFGMADIAPEELVSNLDITFVSSKALKGKNKRYLIGEKVISSRNANPIEMEIKSEKSSDELPVIVALAGLAVDAMINNENKNRITVNYDIALALPYRSMKQGNEKEHSSRFIGTHELIFHHPSGRNVNITLVIEYAKCITEGAAGAWGIVYDEKGKLQKKELIYSGEKKSVSLENKKILHNDIGAGTTELVVTTGVQYDPMLSEGKPFGVKGTIEDIIQTWNGEYDRQIDSVAEFNDIYMNPEHDVHSQLRLFSKDALQGLAIKLAVSIKNAREKLKDNPLTFIYGGGAIILKEFLEDALEARNSLTNVFFLEDPVFVNARGLYVFANTPIFAQLKKIELGDQNGKEEN